VSEVSSLSGAILLANLKSVFLSAAAEDTSGKSYIIALSVMVLFAVYLQHF